MANGIYGPTWPVDGPPPSPPKFSLLNSARIVPDIDADEIERWMNGVEVHSYPPDLADVFDQCSDASPPPEKVEGGVIPLPQFGAFCVYLAETCSALGIMGAGMTEAQAQERFVARALAVLGAVEGQAVEKEFMGGALLGMYPHLADGEGTVESTATDVVEAFGWLEEEIAASGRAGMIHVTPALAVKASSLNLLHEERDGKLHTILGTVVVPGYGYVGETLPDGETSLDPGEEYAFATGPVDIRRSDVIRMPETLPEAMDRSINSVTYRVERYYVVTWDTVVQSAILVDRTA